MGVATHCVGRRNTDTSRRHVDPIGNRFYCRPNRGRRSRPENCFWACDIGSVSPASVGRNEAPARPGFQSCSPLPLGTPGEMGRRRPRIYTSVGDRGRKRGARDQYASWETVVAAGGERIGGGGRHKKMRNTSER